MKKDIDDPHSLASHWATLKTLTHASKKKKAHVDVRASKGRKIRYEVHEKLEHFMSEVSLFFWHLLSSFFSIAFILSLSLSLSLFLSFFLSHSLSLASSFF
jgi:hypothetical protein